MKKELTQERLKELVSYDPETGVFIWLVKPTNSVNVGDGVGSKDRHGHVWTTISGKKYSCHRLAWLYCFGAFPTRHIDHIDHDRSNNRINNLRDVSHQENHKNASLKKNNSSGFSGVSWIEDRKKYYASICVNGKTISLGKFSSLSDAISARKAANLKYGFHSNHGDSSL